MNKFQRYLNKRAKGLLNSEDNNDVEFTHKLNYKECRAYWKDALTNIGHYKISLIEKGINKKK